MVGIPRHFWLIIASLLVFPLASAKGQAWKGIPTKNIPQLKQTAEKGDAAAMADYAYHSLICLSEVPYDQNLIFRYFKQSAAKGNIEGIAGLSHCYRFSIGTVTDRVKSRQLAEEARQGGHPFGAKVLASLALSAKLDGGEPDKETWIKLNQESAKAGCISARFNLALTYTNRIEGKPGKEEGLRQMRELHDAKIFPLATTWLLNDLGRQPIAERDADLYRECYNMAHRYAELGEPDSLYTLGHCYRRAGDLETALAYFFKAAHRGSHKAWRWLWILRQEEIEAEGFRTTLRARNNLAKRAYETGSREHGIVVEAVEEYMRHFKRPEVQALFPNIHRDLLNIFADADPCFAHSRLGQLHDRADPKINPELARPDLSAAHLIYHSDHGCSAASLLAASLGFPIYGRKDTKENLARALVAAEIAREEKHPDWTKKNWWPALQKKMTPEIRKRANELRKDGFPRAEKYQRQAAEVLKRAGQLPARAIGE